eukprot:3226102-Prymnesium_polylepis.2
MHWQPEYVEYSLRGNGPSKTECGSEPQVGSQHDAREADATYDGIEELWVVSAARVNDRRDAVLHGEHVERLCLVVRRGGPMVVDVVGDEAAYRLARIYEETVTLGAPLASEQQTKFVQRAALGVVVSALAPERSGERYHLALLKWHEECLVVGPARAEHAQRGVRVRCSLRCAHEISLGARGRDFANQRRL